MTLATPLSRTRSGGQTSITEPSDQTPALCALLRLAVARSTRLLYHGCGPALAGVADEGNPLSDLFSLC